VEFLRFMTEGVHVKNVGPLIKLASSCEHVAGERHRFALFDVFQLVRDMGGTEAAPVALGGLRVGRFGIVLMGHAATDMWAVMRNVVWEDEHCNVCCGALLKFTEAFDQRVLLRCGPTIDLARDVPMAVDEAREIIDEYWTD
jgi:hypothetical protein